MKTNILYGDAAILCADDLSVVFDSKLNTHCIDLAMRDRTIEESGFAYSPR